MANDNNVLGRLKLEGLPPLRAYMAKVNVEFEAHTLPAAALAPSGVLQVDENGILHVRVSDQQDSANTKDVTIQTEKGRLKEADIERMVLSALVFPTPVMRCCRCAMQRGSKQMMKRWCSVLRLGHT